MTSSSFGFKQVYTRGLILCPNLKFGPEATVNYFLKCYREIKYRDTYKSAYLCQ